MSRKNKRAEVTQSALQALLGSSLPEETTEPASPQQHGTAVANLSTSVIEPNPYQPRRVFSDEEIQHLADSIKQHGLQNPVQVRRHPQNPDRYQLIAGERRFRACEFLQHPTIPAIVVEADDHQALLLALIENLQREDLNPIEEALGFAKLMEEFQLTQQQVAEQVSKARASVANALRLLDLPAEVQTMVQNRQISVGHAKILLSLPADQQHEWAESVVLGEWSIVELKNQIEQAQARLTNTPDTPAADADTAASKTSSRPSEPDTRDPFIEALEDAMRLHFGTRVKLNHRKDNGGIIVLEYYDWDSLEGMLEKMGVSLPT